MIKRFLLGFTVIQGLVVLAYLIGMLVTGKTSPVLAVAALGVVFTVLAFIVIGILINISFSIGNTILGDEER